MTRIGFSGPSGNMKKSVYDPDKDGLIALAQLVSAVCSETEADAIASAATVIMASVAEAALILEHSDLTVAKAATICENAGLTAAKAASIFDEAGLSAQRAADIFDHANLSAAKAGSIAVHANLTQARYDAIVALMVDSWKLAGDATLALFQTNPATGTMSSPERLNDNTVATGSTFGNVIGEYCEVDFGRVVKIDQWREYGDVFLTGNGVWKLQYKDEESAWQDWVTGIAINAADDWRAMQSAPEVITRYIRIIVTTVDDYGLGSGLGELEVYHS